MYTSKWIGSDLQNLTRMANVHFASPFNFSTCRPLSGEPCVPSSMNLIFDTVLVQTETDLATGRVDQRVGSGCVEYAFSEISAG